MNKWDERFMNLARLVAQWSKDESTQVGAVIVDERQRVLSLGFNGQPRGCIDLQGLAREDRLKRTVHAEQNALMFARGSVEGATVYVTAPPCSVCACLLVQSGVKRIVALRPSDAFAQRWAHDLAAASQLYKEACVQFDLQ